MSTGTKVPPDPSLEEKTEAALEAAKLAAKHNVDLNALPKMMDLSPDNITENVLATNRGCNNPRMKFLFQHLVSISRTDTDGSGFAELLLRIV
jgi:hypothetical protein